jgi:D-arabinose 1-dehydrogenase-like Zn-dependent alcohol dehydrogenase
MFPTKGYAAHAADEPLKPFSFERREPNATDVQIDILSAVYVIPICISCATNGVGRSTRACPVTKL